MNKFRKNRFLLVVYHLITTRKLLLGKSEIKQVELVNIKAGLGKKVRVGIIDLKECEYNQVLSFYFIMH